MQAKDDDEGDYICHAFRQAPRSPFPKTPATAPRDPMRKRRVIRNWDVESVGQQGVEGMQTHIVFCLNGQNRSAGVYWILHLVLKGVG